MVLGGNAAYSHLQWCGGGLKLNGTNFLLAPRRGELAWPGVCVSSHEGDDVCV